MSYQQPDTGMDPLLRLLLRRLRTTATDPAPTVETAVELAKRTAEVLERFQQIEAAHAETLPPKARAKYLTGYSVDDVHRVDDQGDLVRATTKPGNLIFRSGAATPSEGEPLPLMPCGDIVFMLGDDTECLRFEPGGAVYVRGELVASNADVWTSFREWLRDCKVKL